uniref:Uncharacterized protein n=1 Tax=Siphoviridae sp. ctbbV81 TaxID=2827900 RepID=A0A8S5TQH7_9CAUD|nr:MAG TPA: protein of unknown function (DUF5565) [Siphoviridae sp. ctbbV81]
MNKKRIKCFLTGGCKIKRSDFGFEWPAKGE